MTLKADPRIKELWVTALESGEYAQTRGTLRDEEGYCCLGVLCSIAEKEGVIPPADQDEDGVYVYRNLKGAGYYTYNEASALPRIVSDWIFPEADNWQSNPEVVYGDGNIADLATLNDTNQLSFIEIAKAIRESL